MSIPKDNCVECGKELHDENSPISPWRELCIVCIYCAAIMQYDENLKLRRAEKIPEDAREASDAVKKAHRLSAMLEKVSGKKISAIDIIRKISGR